MKFRRKPVVVGAKHRDLGSYGWWYVEGESEAVSYTKFWDNYEPIDAEARAAWKEVYGEEYDDTSS